MKFTAGAMVGQLSGSLGSTTASRNRYGSYFRSKVIPVNPDTTRQATMRALFANAVNRWTATLTTPQRNAWSAYANNTPITGKDGNPVTITGQNMYVRTNAARLQAGLAVVDAAPESFNLGNPVSSIQLVSAGTVGKIGISAAETDLAIQANIAGLALETGDVTLFVGPPVNASRKFFKGPWQLAAVVAVTSADPSVNFTTVFTALLSDNGNPAAGQSRAVRLRVHSDIGQMSEPYDILTDVVVDSA